jgi:hypothetical protein
MPKYSVLTAADDRPYIDIEDERPLEELAGELTKNGHIVTIDVSSISGHTTRQAKKIALFLPNVIHIK